MPTAFDGLDAAAFGAVKTTFGEAAVIRPMARIGGPNAGETPDQARAVVNLPAPLAVFDEVVDGVAAPNAWDSRSLDRARLVGASLTLEVETTDVGYLLREGDRVERPGDGMLYSVVEHVARKGVSVKVALAVVGSL